MDSTAHNSQRRQFSVKLWPPSQNTRQMLLERMAHNLSTPSVFTRKYGSLCQESAMENAKQIEDAAFATANQHYEKQPDGDGGSAVQLYAKECSKLIVDVLKGCSGLAKREEASKGERAFIEAPKVTFFNISKGERAFIEADEARELLKPLKEPGNSYTKICFSNRSFSLDAAHVTEPILRSLKNQLKDLDLSDFIAGRSEDEALEVIRVFSAALEGCALRSLDLSHNALGEKGIKAFGELLKSSQQSLEELYLLNVDISEEAAQALCELIPSTGRLAVLHFHNNMTGDEGAQAISRIVRGAPLLSDFQCSSARVDSDGGAALSEALETCTHLKKLDLRDNMFGVAAGLALSKALSKHTNLTEVYLSYLNLEDKGVSAIVSALTGLAPSLEVLDVAGNNITAKAAPALAACIGSKPHLAKLYLAENKLKDEGAICISEALAGLAQVKEVDMSGNMLRRAGAQVLAQTLVNKPEFKLLSMDANFISDEGVDEVKGVFNKSSSLLGPFDENDPEGEDDDDSVGEGESDTNELKSKMRSIDVKEDE